MDRHPDAGVMTVEEFVRLVQRHGNWICLAWSLSYGD